MSENHRCKKCRQDKPLCEFKLRSSSEGRKPSWCRQCSNANERRVYARKRVKAINEPLRRTRASSPPDKALANFIKAAEAAGGFGKLGRHLGAKLESDNPDEAWRAARVILKAAMSVATVE